MVLGVNREEDVETVDTFVEKHSLTFQTFLDPKREVYRRFSPRGIPFNVLIGPDLKVLYSQAGFDSAGLKSAVESALAASRQEEK